MNGALLRVLVDVRRANLIGRLYPVQDSILRQRLLDELVRQRAIVPVRPTATSLGGYVAMPNEQAETLIDQGEPECWL